MNHEEVEDLRTYLGKVETILVSYDSYSSYLTSEACHNYEHNRKGIVSFKYILDFLPDFIRGTPDLRTALRHIENHLGPYGDKQKFLQESFKEIRECLNMIESSMAFLDPSHIQHIGFKDISAQMIRAKALVSTDPASAITKAATGLAGVCKYILASENQEIGKNDKLPSLVKTVAKDILQLDKDLDTKGFSGIANQAQLIAEVRNHYSDSHANPEPDDHLAEYIVTIAGALAILLFKNYEQQKKAQS